MKIKMKNDLLKISEIKNLLIVQIVQYKKVLQFHLKPLTLDGLKLKNVH